MSYQCGISPAVAKWLGTEPHGPRFTCDKCGLRYNIREDRLPPVWFEKGKPVPKWKLIRTPDGTRVDYCAYCKDNI